MTVTITDMPLTAPNISTTLDNCPAVVNADQADANGDGVGNACEGFF